MRGLLIRAGLIHGSVCCASRITVTEQLVAQLNALDGEPDVVVSGSAIGYCGTQTAAVTEDKRQGQSLIFQRG